MSPTRDQRATLGALVDVLLDKGVYLDLDLIITVADIPLIGVNLRATIAGMETLLEYGLMREWDERIRAEAHDDPARG
ncbi:gas vesicle protein GvpM [Microbacterium mangrovi]|uniref:Gas vesicle protein GvpM n=1 Tax=Microbacterium mangrovi TaxID=1348253 RepID=A0A0B2A501_9MICO|nr:gas vesicle protein GvpM [Microbacterium mangrovi]